MAKSTTLHMRADPDLQAKLEARAILERRSVSATIKLLVEDGLAASVPDSSAEPVRPAYTPVELRDPLAIGITAIVPNRAIDGSRVASGANLARSLDRQEVTPNPKRGKEKR